MKSFVVITYYQFMHAVAYALTLDEKPNLYFGQNYLDIDEDFLERIREIGLFNKVVGLSQKEYVIPYVEELKATKKMTAEEIDNIGESIFERYLEPHYEKLFKDADFDDEIFIYNDFQRHYYYISKHFKNIVGVEDGYCSLGQQMKLHWFKGNHRLVEPFLGKYYPEPLYRFKSVKRIISSCYFESLPDYYKEKLEILNFKDLVEKNKSRFTEAMRYVFEIGDLKIHENSVLLLGTPLARARYCDASQAYLFYKKLIEELLSENPDSYIYIKPHPADTLDYNLFGSKRVVVLDKGFPVELLEYNGSHFKKTVSFGSTALVDKLSKNNVTLYDNTGSRSRVTQFIKKYVRNERVTFNVYIKLEKIEKDTYINIYGYMRKYVGFYTNVKVLVKKSLFKKAEEYLNFNNLQMQIKEYKKRKKGSIESTFYNREITELNNLKKGFSDYANIEVISLKSLDNKEIYDTVVKEDIFDYSLVVDARNLGSYVIKKSIQAMRERSVLVNVFLNYTFRSENTKQKVFLGSGMVGNRCTEVLDNRIIHRSFFDLMTGEYANFERLGDLFSVHSDEIAKRAILLLYMDAKSCVEGINEEKYFIEKINAVISDEKDDEASAQKIALILSEYYNWLKIVAPRHVDGATSLLIESVSIKPEVKLKAVEYYLEAILFERKVEQTRGICNNRLIYDYSRNAISRLMRQGQVDRMNKILVRVGKFRKKKRRLKRNLRRWYRRTSKTVSRRSKKDKNGAGNV